MWYWFIWAILICSVVFIVVSTIKNKYLRLTLVILVGIVWHLIPTELEIYNLSYVYTFFTIGYYLDYILDKMSEKFIKIGTVVSILAFVVLVYFWKVDYTIWNTSGYLLADTLHRTIIAIYRFVIGLFGCVTAYVVYSFVYSHFSKGNNVIVRIGKTSLMNYVLHPFAIAMVLTPIAKFVINKVGYNIFATNVWVTQLFFATIISFAMSWLIEIGINLIKKIPYVGKVTFGFNICNAKKENVK